MMVLLTDLTGKIRYRGLCVLLPEIGHRFKLIVEDATKQDGFYIETSQVEKLTEIVDSHCTFKTKTGSIYTLRVLDD